MDAILPQLAKVVVVLVLIDAALYLIQLLEQRFAAGMGVCARSNGGLLLPMARFFKMLYKQDAAPEHVDRVLYTLAPIIAIVPPVLAIAAIPFGQPIATSGSLVELQLANIEAGVLWILTMGIVATYGIAYGAFASNNKYALLGGLRATATLLGSGAVYALAIVTVVMLTGSLRLDEIVAAQSANLVSIIPRWNILVQPVAFLLFTVAALAATSRRPFDLARSGTELVSGYATEYGGIKLALFTWAESALLLTNGMLVVLLFLGGWQVPLLPGSMSPILLGAVQIVVFALKVALVLAVFLWVRWSMPRFRDDQLTRLGWKVLIPLVLLNIAVTGIVMAM